jgi:hypothetical protein
MTDLDVRALMKGDKMLASKKDGTTVVFCAMNGIQVSGNRDWEEQTEILLRRMWGYLNEKAPMQDEMNVWVASHVESIRDKYSGHRYWFLLEQVSGKWQVVAYTLFQFKQGVGVYIVHILSVSSGWNATSKLVAIVNEKAVCNGYSLVFLNFTGEHLRKIYLNCGFETPTPDVKSNIRDYVLDAVHDQLLVRVMQKRKRRVDAISQSVPECVQARTQAPTRARTQAGAIRESASKATAKDKVPPRDMKAKRVSARRSQRVRPTL